MQPKHNKQLVPLAKQLRKEMTKEERHLWYDFLRSYPVRFSRQKVLGKYIADFYCAEAKLVIELDGSQHYEDRNIKKDADRTAFLEGYGPSTMLCAWCYYCIGGHPHFLPLCAEAPKRPVKAEKQADFDGKKALRTSPCAKQQPHP